jgi:hypothetical protein
MEEGSVMGKRKIRNRNVRIEQRELDDLYWGSETGKKVLAKVPQDQLDDWKVDEDVMYVPKPTRFSHLRQTLTSEEAPAANWLDRWVPSKAEVMLAKLREDVSERIVSAEKMGFDTEKLMDIFMGLTASIILARKIQGII